MKIGVDCRLWGETGVGRYIRNLIRQLQIIDDKNEYVLFILSKDYENLKSQISNLKWKIVEADVRWHSVEEQLKFPAILKRENLDLVHFPYFSVPIFYNRPYVVTIHDLIQSHYASGKASTLPSFLYYLKRIGYKKVIENAISKARKIIVPLSCVKGDVISTLRVPGDKIVVTPEGFDLNIKKGKVSENVLNATKDPYFLYVGNAYPHKNLERLMEAFRKLKTKNSKLILVGRKDIFYERLEKNKNDNVIFLHNVSDMDLFYLYSHAIANVSASLMEGFGLPAIEAMASKCLNLLSNIPAFKEVCADAAIYFNPYDVNDLKEEIKSVLDHSNDTYYYGDKRKKGLERVKLFSWKKMATETLKIYESCISV